MNTTGKLLQVRPEDPHWNEVLDFEKTYFSRSWSPAEWLELDWGHHFLFSWFINDKLVGYGLFILVSGDETAHLLKICLHPDSRGKGVSVDFWKSCVQKLKEKDVMNIYLEVEASNVVAIGFYHKLGFKTLKTIKNYYSDGMDALTMILSL